MRLGTQECRDLIARPGISGIIGLRLIVQHDLIKLFQTLKLFSSPHPLKHKLSNQVDYGVRPQAYDAATSRMLSGRIGETCIIPPHSHMASRKEIL
jgi:hypothetical protein